MKNILILNCSPQGQKSNCAQLIKNYILPQLSKVAVCEVVKLAEIKNFQKNKKLGRSLDKASAFLFITGTYWDSWGSPLQKFLEDMTHLEGTSTYLGKPAGVVVLNHSVGGKSILSRLQGVLVTLGCFIPPLSGMVYALNTDLALKNTGKKNQTAHNDDFWSIADLDLVLKNLILSLDLNIKWKAWPVDRENFKKIWIK